MSDVAIRFANVGKMYKIFSSRRQNLMDALGLPAFMRSAVPRYGEFWALRGIDLELRRGERLGIIGRNGAGKSTLLKLVTGNLPPTEGSVEVHGDVQALLEVGGGLHPEFTGRENIDASLGLLGLDRETLDAATDDIAEFTELGRFLDQPFKTYSMGMQARLSLGIATTIRPEILIIDEILGAGDAYFFAKSTARMRDLLDGGAAVLLVSHALDQVVRFCDETIWLDRGRIVMRGDTREVVKAYERFSRELDGRRLEAKNRKARSGNFDSFARDSYTEAITVSLRGETDVTEVALLRDDITEDSVMIGDAQDANTSQAAHISPYSGWSEPIGEGDAYYRKLTGSIGSTTFNLWFYYPTSDYSVRVRYRADGPVDVIVSRGIGDPQRVATLPSTAEWSTALVSLGREKSEQESHGSDVSLSRWTGSSSLTIAEVRLLSGERYESIMGIGDPLTIDVSIRSTQRGRLPLIPAALVFSADGIVVTRHVGQRIEVDVEPEDEFHARLDLGPLMLGNGTYLLSVGLYGRLDPEDVEPPELYDYLDRSFEFRVIGNPKLHNELVVHPGLWVVDAPDRNRRITAAGREVIDA